MGDASNMYEWDEMVSLIGGEEKEEEEDEEMGNVGEELEGAPNANDGDDGSAAAQTDDMMMTVEECLKHEYPLHYACQDGASLEVIKYLVEEADGDKGKELLSKEDSVGRYPLHWACARGTLNVIKYLVEEVEGDKGKELLGKKDNYGRYPLHCACAGGASIDVIKYLVEEADGDKGKELLGKEDSDGKYPLYLACSAGASLEVIKYLVEEADGDKGKELLSKEDSVGMYPLHLACAGGASLDVIKYLVEEADGVKGKELLGKKDEFGSYPLHWACRAGASLDVIKYLVEETDGDKGKELLSKKDADGSYPLHLSCKRGASSDVIKYLVQINSGPLQGKDNNGLTPLDLMDNGTLRAIWGKTHQIGTVADKSSHIDRLNYLMYARALAYASRQAELPGSSLCVGLYGRWGGGKSTLWKQITKCLRAEFLEEDALLLYNVHKLVGDSQLNKKAAEDAKKPYNNAVERLMLDPYVLNDTKKFWRGRETSEESPTAPVTFMEHLARLFLCIFCGCKSCRKGYELGLDDNDNERIQIRSQDARSSRIETNAIFFLIFLISLSPIWIVYWPIYLVRTKMQRETANSNNGNREKDAKQIAGIITGDVPLGDGDAHHWDMVPCGTLFVIALLLIVRAIASFLCHARNGLHYVVCLQWCCSKTNHIPTGAVKYKIVDFNAWTYQGSDLLWASLMKELWDAVQAEFGEKAVRYHRAGIELAEEKVYDESNRNLSPQEKARNRKRALLMFRAQFSLYLFVFLIALAVLLTLTIMNCTNINRTCLGKVVNVTNNATDVLEAMDSSEEEGNGGGVLAAVIATVAAFCPLLANVITFCKKILPYIRKTQGDYILEKASGSTKRKDFKNELGFMGEVKTEIGYLFDLLTTETYLDKEIGCNRSLRLCVFIDDLDRCPKEAVVSVLEAVILLLVDGPISVWMAIDSRIVVQCIEAMKVGLFDKANISGHEFLDKIVQLPFVLPELTNDAKKFYLGKIIDEKELDPARVLSRFMKEGLYERLGLFEELGTGVREKQHKDPIFPLTQIATELDRRGRIISLPGHKGVIGMKESELIKIVSESPQNACDEHRENLCSMISQTTLQFIQDAQLGVSDERQASESNSNGIRSNDADTNGDNVNVLGPPPSGLYIPMMNETDRSCLEALMPFIDGNPRRMKRIINIFNVSRRIAELRIEGSNPILTELTAKILKMAILVEQWPYRMAWLLQFIEDVKQMSDHGVDETGMKRFLEERFGRNEVLPDGSSWVVICRAGILEVYRRVVCDLSMSYAEPSNMGTIDHDPQLFEGLLLCNGEDKQYTITVHDLRPLGCNNIKNETCLRGYMFNMPQAIPGKVSLMMNKILNERINKCNAM